MSPQRVNYDHIAPEYDRRYNNIPFLRKNSCSQLALLSDEQYQAGVAKIENARRFRFATSCSSTC